MLHLYIGHEVKTGVGVLIIILYANYEENKLKEHTRLYLLFLS